MKSCMMTDNNVQAVNFRTQILNELNDDLNEIINKDKYSCLSSAEVYGILGYVLTNYMAGWRNDSDGT